MKKAMNVMATIFVVMLTVCSWILGGIMAYLFVFDDVYFNIDFTTIDAAINTIGEIMLCSIPVCGIFATLCKMSAKEKKMKYVQSFDRMSMNARLG